MKLLVFTISILSSTLGSFIRIRIPNKNLQFPLQADKERAARQREFLAQLEREAAGFDESSEPTSMTNSSTVEGIFPILLYQNKGPKLF